MALDEAQGLMVLDLAVMIALACAPEPPPTVRDTVTIDLPAGITELTESLRIPREARRVIIDGHDAALLLGGFVIDAPGWQPPDAAISAALNEAARAHVRVLKLPTEQLRRWPEGLGGPVHLGHGVKVTQAPSEISVGSTVLVPARWPNDGWAPIERVIDGGSVPRNAEPDIPQAQRTSEPDRGACFVPADRSRLSIWASTEDAWFHGYWNWDWADEQLPAASIDPSAGTVTLAMPHRYGVAARGRFKVSNVLGELDMPGECWIDRASGCVVAWLPPGSETLPVTVSMLTAPMIEVPSGPHAPAVTIRGVRFQCTRGAGVVGLGVQDVRIEDCSFDRIGTKAIALDGDRCVVSRCRFEAIGGVGASIAGGDRATLRRGDGVIEECTFLRCSRLQRSYHPAIEISGVGHRVTRNEIHDLPHMAITYAGNDHVIEANLVHHVVLETGDAGAICTGRDWTSHGNVLRGNLVHDIPGSAERYQNAFYVDDMSSGITIESNLVVRCNWGMLIGGGRDNMVRHNAFVACGLAISYDARGVGWMAPYIADPSTSTLHRRLAEMPIHDEPWRTRFPSLQHYLTDRFGRPVGSTVEGTTLLATPLGRIDDRECVIERGTVTLPAMDPAALARTCDELIRTARLQPVRIGSVTVGPVGPTKLGASSQPAAQGSP